MAFKVRAIGFICCCCCFVARVGLPAWRRNRFIAKCINRQCDECGGAHCIMYSFSRRNSVQVFSMLAFVAVAQAGVLAPAAVTYTNTLPVAVAHHAPGKCDLFAARNIHL